MIILNYTKKNHRAIIAACAHALRAGKVIAFPTETSYGLAAKATNVAAIKKLYQIKGRDFKKPVSVIISSKATAKKIVKWPETAEKLARNFWPGPITLVLPLQKRTSNLHQLTGGSGNLGLRLPDFSIAADLAKSLGQLITATSANVSGKPPAYSATEVITQFGKRKFKPDIIIDAGKLPRHKVSTVVVLSSKGDWQIVRPGPITEKKIKQTLK
jgi:L-threonylcarbamoyladenylate synthase